MSLKTQIALFFIVMGLNCIAQPNLSVKFNLHLDGGSSEGVIITITKNEQEWKTFNLSNSPTTGNIDLELQNVYVFTFSKQGYINKKLRFSTKIPADKMKKDLKFNPYVFDVTLFKQFTKLNTKLDSIVFNQPNVRIAYNIYTDDFDYETQSVKTRTIDSKKTENKMKIDSTTKK